MKIMSLILASALVGAVTAQAAVNVADIKTSSDELQGEAMANPNLKKMKLKKKKNKKSAKTETSASASSSSSSSSAAASVAPSANQSTASLEAAKPASASVWKGGLFVDQGIATKESADGVRAIQGVNYAWLGHTVGQDKSIGVRQYYMNSNVIDPQGSLQQGINTGNMMFTFDHKLSNSLLKTADFSAQLRLNLGISQFYKDHNIGESIAYVMTPGWQVNPKFNVGWLIQPQYNIKNNGTSDTITLNQGPHFGFNKSDATEFYTELGTYGTFADTTGRITPTTLTFATFTLGASTMVNKNLVLIAEVGNKSDPHNFAPLMPDDTALDLQAALSF